MNNTARQRGDFAARNEDYTLYDELPEYLPLHLQQGVNHDDYHAEDEEPLDYLTPLYSACLVGTFIFVFFSYF